MSHEDVTHGDGGQTGLGYFESIAEPTKPDSPDASDQPLPETPPEYLFTNGLPPVYRREQVLPEDPVCEVKTGDILFIHVGTDAMDWYAELLLEVGASYLVSYNIGKQRYTRTDLESWEQWFDKYASGDGTLTQDNMRFYGDAVEPAETPSKEG